MHLDRLRRLTALRAVTRRLQNVAMAQDIRHTAIEQGRQVLDLTHHGKCRGLVRQLGGLGLCGHNVSLGLVVAIESSGALHGSSRCEDRELITPDPTIANMSRLQQSVNAARVQYGQTAWRRTVRFVAQFNVYHYQRRYR